jgi:histidyl-tRNA synthetase
MPALQPVRGTRDILPEESRRRRGVEQAAFDIAQRYGYGEISTPIFEFTEVFARTLGDSSDIVTKEMYTFEDRGGDRVTLRPENTAGVVRAFISNGLAQQTPLKLFYRGPMFRYERPQKGRYRQFHQVGVELLGVADPLADAEVIALGADFLAALGLEDKIVLELNTLGDGETRQAYRAVLVDYLQAHRTELSEDSLVRLERNPLRVLDSKDERDRSVVAEAPLITDSLNQCSRDLFDTLTTFLRNAGVAYRVNPKLVRGLDYYCHTAFEFTTDALGAQGAVLAGGRYDGLVQQMGGPPVPGTGWAAGVERLMMLADSAPPLRRPVAVVPQSNGQVDEAFVVSQRLRRAGFAVDLGFSGNLGKRMKRANKIEARVALILGEEECARGGVTVRDMDSGEQGEVPLTTLEDHLARYY